MLPLTATLEGVGKALNDALPGLVFHYYRPGKTRPYLIWAESTESDAFYSDNHKSEQSLSILADYYTQEEYDPNIDTIQNTLDNIADAWRIDSVLYEEETQLIHYAFTFEMRVINGEV